jgi:hypothetical protein
VGYVVAGLAEAVQNTLRVLKKQGGIDGVMVEESSYPLEVTDYLYWSPPRPQRARPAHLPGLHPQFLRLHR